VDVTIGDSQPFALSKRPARERNFEMLRFVLATLITLAGFAIARPTINDDGFDYTSPSKGSYYSLDIVDGHVVVTLSHEATPDSITHSFPTISRTELTRLERLYGNGTWIEFEAELEAEREALRDRARSLAGMGDLGPGWQITHRKMNLATVIAAYTKWFTDAGLAVTPDTRNTVAAVRPFDVTGSSLASDLRVVFARKGDSVRVFIGSL
jgi:hypothetical protein